MALFRKSSPAHQELLDVSGVLGTAIGQCQTGEMPPDYLDFTTQNQAATFRLKLAAYAAEVGQDKAWSTAEKWTAEMAKIRMEPSVGYVDAKRLIAGPVAQVLQAVMAAPSFDQDRESGASPDDLETADRLMTRFGEVRGNGSDQDLAEVLEQFQVLSGMPFSSGWNSPWKPWIKIAQQAHDQGHHALTYKIFSYGVDFTVNIGPKLTGPFSVGLGYGPMDATDYKALATVGLASLNIMQAERPDIDFAPEIDQAYQILAR